MATNMNGSPLVTGGTVAVFDNDMAIGGRTIVIPIVFGGPRAARESATPWTVIRQGVPLPSDGTCTSVADNDHAWGTGLSGGWVNSWEQWVHAGEGGWACNRALVHKGGPGWVIDNAAQFTRDAEISSRGPSKCVVRVLAGVTTGNSTILHLVSDLGAPDHRCAIVKAT